MPAGLAQLVMLCKVGMTLPCVIEQQNTSTVLYKTHVLSNKTLVQYCTSRVSSALSYRASTCSLVAVQCYD